MRREAFRQVQLRVDDPLDRLLGDRGRRLDVVDGAGLPRRAGRGGDDRARLRRLGGQLARLCEGPLELLLVVPEYVLRLIQRDIAASDQRLGVQLPGRALGIDQVVHQRLGERGVVGLVVAAAPVADHVDDDVLGEGLAVGERQPSDPDHGFRVVAVHVEDRRLDRAGHVGGVHA